MNRQLHESLNQLVRLFESARERERADEPLRYWKAARAHLEESDVSDAGKLELERLRECLVNLEWVVRCWLESGFQGSFRLAGELLELARSRWSEKAHDAVHRAA